MKPATANRGSHPAKRPPYRFSLAGLLMLLSLIALGSGYIVTLVRLRNVQAELAVLRQETGYLEPTPDGTIAAVRLTSDQPMTYRLRVRVPQSPPYRIAYSSVWPTDASAPRWFAAVPVPPGESVVVVRVLNDPRDGRWKITTLRRAPSGTRRVATVLPAEHIAKFRGSHDWLSTGVTRSTASFPGGESLRILDERILAGEGATMLYGDKPPDQDMVGVYAELQPDVGPL
ncbi:hypothetical protein FYK55_20625 [Roseiconus nitratireducens]|uniref:Uncharacterized protein n=1 Tax=Roseiconus nitratireducens TaxID=2605748 RepID=A0A5M6D1P0_9BACT|nr:hypothetical protein FYK55_20625 [Roseiconus nitratireducens]